MRLPDPCFVSVDDDGCITVEWIFGSQGDGQKRCTFGWDPKEGAFAFAVDKMEIVKSGGIAPFLREWFVANKESSETGALDGNGCPSCGCHTEGDVECGLCTFEAGKAAGVAEATACIVAYLRSRDRPGEVGTHVRNVCRQQAGFIEEGGHLAVVDLRVDLLDRKPYSLDSAHDWIKKVYGITAIGRGTTRGYYIFESHAMLERWLYHLHAEAFELVPAKSGSP